MNCSRERRRARRYATATTGSDSQGPRVFEHARRLGAEGVVSKRRDRAYVPGRNTDWLKAKCTLRQEFVVAGFTDPEGSRSGIGALLLGYYEGERLAFAGRVGTGKGWTGAFLEELRRGLNGLEQTACPFSPQPPRALAHSAHWVRPALVVEVEFVEWTSDGSVRHPTFVGFRPDVEPA